MAAQRVHRVDEIAFESVERLEADRDATARGMVADDALHLHRAFELVGRRALAREMAERGVQRTAERRGAQRARAVDRPAYVLDAGGAFGRVRRNQVLFGLADRRDRRPLEPDPVEHCAETLVIGRRALEDRNFDAVEPGRPDILQQSLVVLRDGRRPQEHAHADLHTSSPPARRGMLEHIRRYMNRRRCPISLFLRNSGRKTAAHFCWNCSRSEASSRRRSSSTTSRRPRRTPRPRHRRRPSGR